MDRLVTDLPQPDSPTIPNTSPGKRSNETRSTAVTAPRSVLKRVERWLTLRIGSSDGIRDGFLKRVWDRKHPVMHPTRY